MIDVFIDTNVLIYSMDTKSSFYNMAKGILFNPEYNLLISNKNISELVCAVTRYSLASYEKIMRSVESFCDSFSILFPDSNSFEIFLELLRKHQPLKNRVFDLEIVSIMLANGITRIATFNEKDFIQVPGIEIIST